MRINDTIAELDGAISRLRSPNVSSVRELRRELSRQLRTESPANVLAIANRLAARDGGWDRFVSSELVAAHHPTMQQITARDIQKLGKGIDSWDDVDVFASYVTGPAWRDGRIGDAEVARWARSKDVWWRRTAIVSTVPLNNRARGGRGEAQRTLAVCKMLLDDLEPMVVKAMSWALRELSKRDPIAVENFIARYNARVAALVRREVQAKLTTGLKNPNSRGRAK